ncbi:hypothetical protein K461DRAFT_275821 [Myriangium duriaei CBS 260.36]|uniref:Vezatin n=1 Tax=Myriangium duriaei CBS 260.36 TaxID=1168546 RepID=A0A9P4J3Y0_9PEZI|nr:hypothetical protein K461DRAFT_275821 [Myriangium duriaei CBS 260.36]
MESIFPEDSPLASILEGEGQNSLSRVPSERSTSPGPDADPNFAPLCSTTLRSHLGGSTIKNLRLKIPHSRKISEAHQAWTRAIDMRVGMTENTRFLDRFRYILVASQLLEESPDHSLLQISKGPGADSLDTPVTSGSLALYTNKGAALTACIAFLTVWIFAWALSSSNKTIPAVVVLTHCALTAAVIYFHGRRQMIKYLRVQVLSAAATLVRDLQNFELSTGTSISLLQDVEVVARGYGSNTVHSTPKADDTSTLRRCLQLRRCLSRSLSRMTDGFNTAHIDLAPLVDPDDYNKFLDIYDVSREGIQQAMSVRGGDEMEAESSGALRILNYRASVLRRAILCILLSLEAEGDVSDYDRWRTVTGAMMDLSKIAKNNSQRLVESLESLETLAVSPSPIAQPKHANERLRTQVRKISTLSSGIKTLQAKMTILREESNSAMSRADDLTDLGPLLTSQYESIGSDIQALLREWEHGKAALSANIIRHERRISLASSPGVRSPTSTSTFSGLLSVDEGGPADALLALTGENPSSRRDTSTSPRSSMPATPSDEEVFEAIAIPKQRQRSSLSREDRIRLMHEERAKAEERKVRRESGLNMMRELRSVINLRKKPDQPAGPRVTSI